MLDIKRWRNQKKKRKNLHNACNEKTNAMKSEKGKDKNLILENELSITFDFEKVINLQKARTINYFYKCKLALHKPILVILGKCRYCAFYPQLKIGETGSNKRNASISISKTIVTYKPTVTNLIFSPDICLH